MQLVRVRVNKQQLANELANELDISFLIQNSCTFTGACIKIVLVVIIFLLQFSSASFSRARTSAAIFDSAITIAPLSSQITSAFTSAAWILRYR